MLNPTHSLTKSVSVLKLFYRNCNAIVSDGTDFKLGWADTKLAGARESAYLHQVK